ncbi:MAG: hypothetical protein LBR73_04495 [Oscillospiraceae bacterium]|jgi:hypothetical protein|nr:hypothetical protein [Oscillospiraceae bacterium]
MKRTRLYFLLTVLVLFALLAVIALCFRDGFVRPYLGDVLVVVFIWALLRNAGYQVE